MKTRPFFKPLLLLVLLLAAGGFCQQAKAQEDTCAVNVIHTYMNGVLIPWDSVEVRVCLPPCEYPYHYRIFKMYWPDTILSNCTTGVDEYVQDNEWGLSQNYPNPCMGESSVKLTTRTAGSVKLQVTDMQGRLCCQRTEMLPAGEHQLSVTLPHSGVYFVQAETNDGRETCKVLCSEGKGSSFDIRLSSTSPQLVEKAERGGEGLFNMIDYMRITAYITYNGEVMSQYRWVNYDSYHCFNGDSLYLRGSVNVFFGENIGCDSFSFEGQVVHIMIATRTCLPFTDYPIGCTVNFYDSIFYAEPSIHFQQLSSTWNFDGWYKYRYFPEFDPMYVDGLMCICRMDEMLPENLEDVEWDFPWMRAVVARSCRIAYIGWCTLYDHTARCPELMIKEE